MIDGTSSRGTSSPGRIHQEMQQWRELHGRKDILGVSVCVCNVCVDPQPKPSIIQILPYQSLPRIPSSSPTCPPHPLTPSPRHPPVVHAEI